MITLNDFNILKSYFVIPNGVYLWEALIQISSHVGRKKPADAKIGFFHVDIQSESRLEPFNIKLRHVVLVQKVSIKGHFFNT